MYSAEINRMRPACLLILIDHSSSMGSPWADTGTSMAEQLALAVNRLLGNAVLLCSKGDNRVYDYFEIGVIGYGTGVSPALHGSDAGHIVLPISQLAEHPKRVDQVTRKIPDGAGGIIEATLPIPVWVDPVSNGWTPMVAALETAERVVADWCARHQTSFPPIVINVTDGESTDGDPRPAADRVRSVKTADGAVLLFNVHLAAGPRQAVSFPSSPAGLPASNADVMFEMSSVLPGNLAEAAAALGYHIEPGSRGFLYNADATTMIEFLDIGTRAVTPNGLRELTDGTDDDMR
ncbi:vWA domain-containing protein [Dactylosporangium siamense]|uniref:VWFA domain-containing protein n=1 Tax=Dactylosporangium siamense TaxID=685454 RepID=A0A919PXA9_9ACTN|nr:hypothetical protein Dsi01nite_100530 [Dactylosporangium siamense]